MGSFSNILTLPRLPLLFGKCIKYLKNYFFKNKLLTYILYLYISLIYFKYSLC